MTNHEHEIEAALRRPAGRGERVLEFLFASAIELLALFVVLTSLTSFVPGGELTAASWGLGIGLAVVGVCVVHERRRDRSTRPIAVWALLLGALGALLQAESLLSILCR